MANPFAFTALTTGQSAKEASINTAVDEIAGVLGAKLDIAVVGGSNTYSVAPTASECKRYSVYRFIDDTGTPPTNVWEMVMILTNMPTRPFIVVNDCSKAHIIFRNIASTDQLLSIAPGERETVVFNSTLDLIKLVGSPYFDRLLHADVASTVNRTVANVNSGDTEDGVTLTVGMFFLMKDQSTDSQNGLYVVGNDQIHRVRFMDTGAVLPKGTMIAVRKGTASGGKVYTMASAASTIATDPNTWAALLTGSPTAPTESIIVPLGDEVTPHTTGQKMALRAPYAFVLTGIKASLTVAQSSGSIFTMDVKESGTTILSTLITIDNTEKTTATAATAAVISDANIAADAELTFHITQVGAGADACGAKITLIGHQ